MTAVDADVRRCATLPADRDRVWEELADVSRLDRLMPHVARYERHDHGWHWVLEGRRILGHRIQPRFTVAYELSPPERLTFAHVRGDGSDTADSSGGFTLRAVDGGTEVTVELAVRVDVDLPALLRGPVRQVLRDEIAAMADGFLGNLRSAVGS